VAFFVMWVVVDLVVRACAARTVKHLNLAQFR